MEKCQKIRVIPCNGVLCSLLKQWELLDAHCRRQLQLQLHFLDTRTRTVFLVIPVTFRSNACLGYSSKSRHSGFRCSDSFDPILF